MYKVLYGTSTLELGLGICRKSGDDAASAEPVVREAAAGMQNY
jgi:hypothetical protein